MRIEYVRVSILGLLFGIFIGLMVNGLYPHALAVGVCLALYGGYLDRKEFEKKDDNYKGCAYFGIDPQGDDKL